MAIGSVRLLIAIACLVPVPSMAESGRNGSQIRPYIRQRGVPLGGSPFGSAHSGVAPRTDAGVIRGGFLPNAAGVRGGGVVDQQR